ncbi:hypothetical protein sce8356 [Sorangium cellulosum So ce56]|uniref:DUF2169 domain-containing protein n=1 Tax=Sorangium cellulosum (strain So ce56) TaxID=448385 RepID=A9FTG0_SORC5|nr:DUF2169 domain-containing protein [Sorangium cellulosum]CAN98526.1 hypothetical protein sce8356 [Sorangium cellulosum So ce56]
MRAPPAPRALGHAAAAVRPFRSRGRVMLAVVVKATFRLEHKRAMSPLPPAPIVAADVRAARAAADPRAAVSAASEMAPFLPRADILLGGHAWARGRSPAPLVPVRLRVGLDAAVLLDKSLHVYGDRGGNGRGAPQPFLAMPLGYERALGGAADPDNPAGVDPRAGRAPNIIDPRQPTRAAGLGPIAAHWPARQRRLGNADPRGVQAPWPVVPDGFDWAYFQAAPADQQTPYLRGNEWILIEGMHPDLDRIEAWLPGPVAEARVAFGGAAQPQVLPLVADMLVIDADRWLCSLVWRASALLPGEEALASVRVTARVALPGEAVPWDVTAAPPVRAERAQAAPQRAQAAQAPAAASPQRAGRGAEHPLAGTVALDPEEAPAAASPQRAGRGAADHPLSGTVAVDPDEGPPSPALPFRSPAASAEAPRLARSGTAELPAAAGTPPAEPRRGGLPFVAPAAGAASRALPFAPAAPSSPGARDGAAAWALPFAAPAAASPAAPVRAPAASGVLPFVSPAAASGALPFAPAPSAPVPAAPQAPSAHPPAPSAPERSSPWVSGAAPHAASEPRSPWVSGAAAAAAHVASPPPVAPSYALAPPRIAPSYALESPPAAAPWPATAAAAAAPARRPARPRRPRLAPDARPSSEPLIPPRKRRPAKVAADGLGASFLRSVPDAAPSPT